MGAAPRRGAPVGALDLRSLELPPGGAARLDVPVPAAGLELGGQRYRVEPAAPEVRLDVTRALSGTHLRLRASAELVGPCWRCLTEARAAVAIDTSEFAASGRAADAPFDEDLDSDYLEGDGLDLAGWLRDALVEALPATILCREDCAGLCATCGAELADGPCGCTHESVDPRWAALGELAERMRAEGA